jgi:hypothetical protein
MILTYILATRQQHMNLFPSFRRQINQSLTIEAETAYETLEIRSISTWLITGEDRITLDTVQRNIFAF